jgi:hypothetical protein
MTTSIPDSANDNGGWSSLEKAQFWVSVLQVIASAGVSIAIFYYGHKYSEVAAFEADRAQKFAQVTKQRIAIWDKVAGDINDIYCYFLFVGDWKHLTPDDIIQRKRSLDKTMYSYRPFFTDEFFGKYMNFIDSTYKPFGGWEKDAKLRTAPVRPSDNDSDKGRFTNEDNRKAIFESYSALIKSAGAELDVNIDRVPTPKIEAVPTLDSRHPDRDSRVP